MNNHNIRIVKMEHDTKTFKILPVLVFVALVIKVTFSIIQIANGTVTDSIGSLLELSQKFFDTLLWLVLAIWFLHAFLYAQNAIGRKTMRVATISVVVTGIIVLLSKMVVTLTSTENVMWMMAYSIVEFVVIAIISSYLLKIYLKYRKEQKRLHYRKKHKSDATLLDALLGRI